MYIVAIQFWGNLNIKYGIVELKLLAQQIEKQTITSELNFQLFTFVRMECFCAAAYKLSLKMCRIFQYYIFNSAFTTLNTFRSALLRCKFH